MLNIIEVIVQTVLAFFALLFYARLLGKQQISQLTFYEYINGITIGSIGGTLATDINERTLNHFLALTFFVILTFVISQITLKSRPLRKVLEGEPTILIHNGKILENNMGKMRYNLDELNEQLREKDVFDIGDVEYAIAETDGSLSVLLKSSKQPLTPNHLHIPTEYQGISSELIMDGKVIYQNLKQNNLTQEWLFNQLRSQGIYSVGEVNFAVLNSKGQVYVDRIQDNLSNIVDISDKNSK